MNRTTPKHELTTEAMIEWLEVDSTGEMEDLIAGRLRDLEEEVARLKIRLRDEENKVDRLDFFLSHASEFTYHGHGCWEWKGDPDENTGRHWEVAVDMAHEDWNHKMSDPAGPENWPDGHV